MKIVYGGDLDVHGTCAHRMQAMSRLGFDVHAFDFGPCLTAGGPILYRVRQRLLVGPMVKKLNRDLLDFCSRVRPDFIWLDKPIFVHPETVLALRHLGAIVINYVLDNPYGTLFGPWFRLIRSGIAHYDVNVVPRPCSVTDFTAAGAGHVILMPLSFDPLQHFPMQKDGATIKTVALSFIGFPYDQRPRFLTDLAASEVPLLIRGDHWHRHLPRQIANVTFGPSALGAEYRRAIQTSAICLSFVTHCNRDPCAHKTFEITACGTFLLAERTYGHEARFKEGVEAEFFSSVAEAADKTKFYLAQPEQRETIARAGCRRAWSSGYSNDERIATAFSEIDRKLGRVLTERADVFIGQRRAELGLS